MDTDEMVRDIEEGVNGCVAIAFDGCHKIYILLDDEQADKFKGYDYGKYEGSHLITSDEMSADGMAETVMNWYGQSCSLKFVSAVGSVDGDPNKGYVDVIPQGAGYDDEDDE
jgi:hypothetical protein